MPSSPHQSAAEEESSTDLMKNSPERYPPTDKAPPSDTRASPVVTDDPMEISDEGDLEVDDDHLVYFGDRNIWKIGRSFEASTFTEQGIIICPEHPGADVPTVISRLLPRDIYHVRQNPYRHHYLRIRMRYIISTRHVSLIEWIFNLHRHDWQSNRKCPIY